MGWRGVYNDSYGLLSKQIDQLMKNLNYVDNHFQGYSLPGREG